MIMELLLTYECLSLPVFYRISPHLWKFTLSYQLPEEKCHVLLLHDTFSVWRKGIATAQFAQIVRPTAPAFPQ